MLFRSDVAFQCGWPKATELGLGAFGEGSGLRWRNALNYARGRLGQLAVADAPLGVRTQVDLLADWIEAELLLLDAQALPMCDPASHVRQAARTLRAATEAEWLPPERRKQEVTELLTQLPAYLAEARLSLLAPSAPWIDLALCDMDDLERIVAELEELLDAPGAEPAARAGARRERAKAAAEPAEKAWTKALVDFRGWLLALSTEARSRPPTLDYAEWTRLVQFTLGRAWNPGEIKARCLRDLAQLELAAPRRPGTSNGGTRGSDAGKPAAGQPGATKSGAKATDASQAGAGNAKSPGTSEPAASKPAETSTAASKPGAGKARAKKAGAGKPATSEPGASSTSTGEPAASKPAETSTGASTDASKPGAGKARAKKAGAGKPATSEPGASGTSTGEPGASKPDAAKVGASTTDANKSAAGKAGASDPSASGPVASKPAGEANAGKPAKRKRSKAKTDKPLALQARFASSRVLDVARQAHLLPKIAAKPGFEFASEESPCSGLEIVSLRAGGPDALRAVLQLPNRSWTTGRTTAREAEFGQSDLLALGARYGLTGEALFRRARAADESLLAYLPVNRAQTAAIGLYAQDWIVRVDWCDNPLAKNPRLVREVARQRGMEAARLLAALEIHAEGISVDEAAASFRRRTGVHEEVALAEALSAEHDPLHGIGYLGLLELQALERRLAAVSTPRRALDTALLLLCREPTLRATDLAPDPAAAVAIER